MPDKRYQEGLRITWIGMFVNLSLCILKGFAGIVAGSTALIADAFHSLSDIAGSAVVVWGLKLAGHPPDQEHHYGHAKIESVVAKLIAVLLVLTGTGVGWAAFNSIKSDEVHVPGVLALAAAAVAIIVKETMYRLAIRVGRKIGSSAVMADAWHHRSDALSSVAAMLGVGGAMAGFPLLDPLAGIIVAMMIVFSGIKIYMGAVRELIDTAPDQEIIDRIREITFSTEGVKGVDEIKARIHGPGVLVDIKICVNPYITVEAGHDIGTLAKDRIMSAVEQVQDVMVHINPHSGDFCKNNEE